VQADAVRLVVGMVVVVASSSSVGCPGRVGGPGARGGAARWRSGEGCRGPGAGQATAGVIRDVGSLSASLALGRRPVLTAAGRGVSQLPLGDDVDGEGTPGAALP
jgi:hypothetical protein